MLRILHLEGENRNMMKDCDACDDILKCANEAYRKAKLNGKKYPKIL